METGTLLLLILLLYLVIIFAVGTIGTMIVLLIFKYRKNILKFFHDLFVPQIQVVKGRVIAMKSRMSFVPAPISAPSDSFINTPGINILIPITEYLVYMEDGIDHKKRFLEISRSSFEELKEKKKTSEAKKETSFYFKKYSLFEPIFDHLEFSN